MEKIKLYKGIFWLISGYDGSEMLYCVKVPRDKNGIPTKQVEFSSKSGDKIIAYCDCATALLFS